MHWPNKLFFTQNHSSHVWLSVAESLINSRFKMNSFHFSQNGYKVYLTQFSPAVHSSLSYLSSGLSAHDYEGATSMWNHKCTDPILKEEGRDGANSFHLHFSFPEAPSFIQDLNFYSLVEDDVTGPVPTVWQYSVFAAFVSGRTARKKQNDHWVANTTCSETLSLILHLGNSFFFF